MRKLRMAAYGGRRHPGDRLYYSQLHRVWPTVAAVEWKRAEIVGKRNELAMVQVDSYCRSCCKLVSKVAACM